MNKYLANCRLGDDTPTMLIAEREMNLLASEEALGMLDDHAEGLRAAVLAAWDDYVTDDNYSPMVRAAHCSTTRANCVHDRIKSRVTEYASRFPSDLRVQHIARMFTVVGKDAVAIRFKKLDRELQTANHPTRQALAFKRQQQISLIENLCHLEVGYLLDPTEQHVQAIFVMCPNGENEYYWVSELVESSSVPVVRDIFEGISSIPSETANEGVVRPRERANIVKLRGVPAPNKES